MKPVIHRISGICLLFFLFSIGALLGGCSLAEDITPPPGYQYSTITPAMEQGSPTPAATDTPAGTAASVASAVPSTSVIPAGTVSPAAGAITFTGKITNDTSGGSPSGSLKADLYLFNTATSKIDQTLSTDVDAGGQYRFENVPADTKASYFVVVDYAGVTYASEPVAYDGKVKSLDVPIKVYDATSDLAQLSISQVHVQFGFPSAGKAEARVLYIISNLGDKAVVVQSDGKTIPFIQTPAGATNAGFDLAQGGAALSRAAGGFALLPGADKQYGIIDTFNLPYNNSLSFEQPFTLPVSSATVLVPVGVKVKSDQLSDAGVQNFQGTNYHLYQGGILASGSSLILTVSGKPGDSAGITVNQQLILMGILLLLGILLIGTGVFLLRRNRKKALAVAAGPAAMAAPEANQEDSESLMDAIIALDDQYKTGCLTKETYARRRAELKKRLKESL